eukprot:TRINITY_DN46625_c0_g1_i1.p1 TRINITY_DN46625_c0_g1~~TRINITY_DN46625_c0_g1_i1.p1  ORF type:complete len:227 (-),score=42.81 TRINITY_DN46625_c0_g1_i1:569-1249(-)
MASQDASARGKRPPTDPRGPVLELLSAFKIGGRNGYYDDKVRGKVLRMDNLLASSGTARDGAKAKARPSYGGGRHRRAAAADGEDGSDAVDSWKTLKYEDFQPLRDLWNAYFDDLVRPAGKNLTDDMLAEVLSAADLHGCTLSVVQAKNPGCVRLRGTVIEETQGTMRIITADSKTKVLPKESCVFEVEASGRHVRLLGPAWAHRVPRGVPGPHAPQRWTLQKGKR